MPNEPVRDEELVALIARRDRAAFESLYDRYASRALGLAIHIFRERTIAEDILQEAFWRVWQRAATFDTERGAFLPWLMSIVHHLAIDRLRRSRGMPATIEIDSDAEATLEIHDTSQDVPAQAWERLQAGMMRDALARLPEAQRMVIEMAYFEGLTRQEIAAKLNEPLGTVHTRARLGLAKMKEMLSELQGNER